ncbi:SMODS domain-containing nucleotidyltransferase [Planococcus lenghuensis]|uniref:Nucleotidyltransferase n=1 Tax=Planococcus lenghuensis TaxID=2213202 RepID=A0A1Q2L4A8_9BACL|nr:nucleotidyltransferase [Planococcus lenghuensis]AQQ55256.1 nucleotidyltransferase [Planococcus lenghuensis]
MSVQSHLSSLSSALNLQQEEKDKVSKSVDTLSSRLNTYFSRDLDGHFKFGSYTRRTVLPRKADENSDVDYMVVFKNPYEYKPQTLLNHLKAFVNKYYYSSEIYQSHPTIVLELNHIKFELVPAKKDFLGNLYIPSPSSSYTEWMITQPNTFNSKLSDANATYHNQIKPLVRLLKYWNRLNGSHRTPYLLEKWVVDNYYWNCINIKEFVYSTFEKLDYDYTDSQNYKDKVNRAKRIIAKTKELERDNLPISAENEIKKLFPNF